MRPSKSVVLATAAALVFGLASVLGVSQPASAADPPDSPVAAAAGVESAQTQLAAAEREVRTATQQASRLAYSVVALRVQQVDAQVALSAARGQARRAIRAAYDTASVDPTATLFAALSGDDPDLVNVVRDRRLSDAAGRTRELQAAAGHLHALAKDLTIRRTAAVKAAAQSVSAADTARGILAAAEKSDLEQRRRAELAAQHRELDKLTRELVATLAAVYASAQSTSQSSSQSTSPSPSQGSPGGEAPIPDSPTADSPATLRSLYTRAAATCPGLPWGVLAGIGQVETDHGRVKAVSSAGATGPMQFLPSTWTIYGVDGDGDGKADILDQADAVYSAAHYLCASGGGRSDTLYDAIFAYNHSNSYVNTVLELAVQYQ